MNEVLGGVKFSATKGIGNMLVKTHKKKSRNKLESLFLKSPRVRKYFDDVVSKAISVSADPNDSDVSSYLPVPLANTVIEYIRELNVMRRLLNTFKMSTRTYKKPKRNSGMSAYFIPDGVAATETGFTSTSLTWTAKKLMSYVVVDEEAVEDSQPDLIDQILRDFAAAVAEAEELAILQGDPTHTATAPDPTSATAGNWYVRDSRLAFKGIFTAAAEADAADAVDAASTAFDVDMVNKAIYNLGKYGRNKSTLIALAPSDQAANIRGCTSFASASTTGLALASFVSGMGSAGEGMGIVTNVFGVNVYEVPQAPAGKIAILWKNSPEIGDRRLIKFASDVVIEQDQRKYVVSERIAFNFNYQEALVLITNLSQTIVS